MIGNILLISLFDEENLSSGMKAAVELLIELKSKIEIIILIINIYKIGIGRYTDAYFVFKKMLRIIFKEKKEMQLKYLFRLLFILGFT